MSNAMRLLLRTVIIMGLMVIGAWLNAQFSQSAGGISGGSGMASFIILYVVYLLIGITAGSMVNPRFSKNKSKWIHLIPVVIFTLIGAQWFFYPLFSIASLPLGIGGYLLQFSYLSWTLSGIFLNLSFR